MNTQKDREGLRLLILAHDGEISLEEADKQITEIIQDYEELP